ncbi:Uncharacterised protein [Delftia tsuruhatensis]|uniref:ribbon-helix-helix domain-containing protein n=1 Tax=Delftia tsuruhatensis TaxID=180282 RepID=UPI001E7A4F9A|nr:ribbon-helix-helix domain-containing protein [Delftia tsuruhatensis]CAB5691955.1 Uncharacterised protein [Delftia tsuruhatensis]CAC9676818.1 Uncharacterised protein [Delftia tsuruhatensis]
MCEVYVRTDPINYESRSHSVRIHGVITTVRLENEFWTVLGAMARGENRTTNELIATLYDEVTKFRGEIDNFASFLRVSCMRYQELKAARDETPQVPRPQAQAPVVVPVRNAS